MPRRASAARGRRAPRVPRPRAGPRAARRHRPRVGRRPRRRRHAHLARAPRPRARCAARRRRPRAPRGRRRDHRRARAHRRCAPPRRARLARPRRRGASCPPPAPRPARRPRARLHLLGPARRHEGNAPPSSGASSARAASTPPTPRPDRAASPSCTPSTGLRLRGFRTPAASTRLHAISGAAARRALAVGDTEATELGHRNCSLQVPTRLGNFTEPGLSPAPTTTTERRVRPRSRGRNDRDGVGGDPAPVLAIAMVLEPAASATFATHAICSRCPSPEVHALATLLTRPPGCHLIGTDPNVIGARGHAGKSRDRRRWRTSPPRLPSKPAGLVIFTPAGQVVFQLLLRRGVARVRATARSRGSRRHVAPAWQDRDGAG